MHKPMRWQMTAETESEPQGTDLRMGMLAWIKASNPAPREIWRHAGPITTSAGQSPQLPLCTQLQLPTYRCSCLSQCTRSLPHRALKYQHRFHHIGVQLDSSHAHHITIYIA
eukprot:356116-Chlamydomonas_euryale.AAC.7